MSTGESDQIERQHDHLKVKVSEIYGLIHEMHELSIDLDGSDDVINGQQKQKQASVHLKNLCMSFNLI